MRSIRIPVARAVPWLVAGLALSTPGAPSHAEDAVVVPLRPYVGRLVTAPVVAGRDTLHLLLDTGGGETLITPEVARSLGCVPHGRSVGFRMTGERVEFARCNDVTLEIGGRGFPHREIGVWDIMAILPEGLPPLDGVLALDTFAEQPFTLDLQGRELILEGEGTLANRIEGMTRVEARVSTGPAGGDLTLFVRGVLDEPGWFLLDSGNLDEIQIAPHMIHRTGPVPRVIEGVGFELQGLPPAEVSVQVAEIIYDGALAESFLREWIWTFDPGTGSLWAKRRASRRP